MEQAEAKVQNAHVFHNKHARILMILRKINKNLISGEGRS
jgi:hypothetical protein